MESFLILQDVSEVSGLEGCTLQRSSASIIGGVKI